MSAVSINNSKISIGPAYYNRTFAPILIPFILLMAIAPFLSWGKSGIKILLNKLIIFSGLTLIGILIFYYLKPSSIFAIICGSLSISLFISITLECFNKLNFNKRNLSYTKRLNSLPKNSTLKTIITLRRKSTQAKESILLRFIWLKIIVTIIITKILIKRNLKK